MLQILACIQYMPDKWKEQPHTAAVQNEFSQLFQFKLMGLVDELLSPILTPFVLYFNMRPMAQDIVTFLHDFTIDVSGVGDVCSFAEMNVKRHGSPDWMSTNAVSSHQQTELGKTELSLVQFHNKHPTWQPSEEGTAYLSKLKESMTTSRVITDEEESLNYISICPSSYIQQAPMVDSMQWSIWSVQQQTPPTGTSLNNAQSMDASMLDTLQLHKVQTPPTITLH